MIEIIGNAWSYYGQDKTIICITTNGFLKQNGEAVMGRGIAFQAAHYFPEMPELLGEHIRKHGNVPTIFEKYKLITFPVKRFWFEKASLEIIKQSAELFLKMLKEDWTYILTRPDCNNGKLDWKDVKPIIEFLPDNVKVITNERPTRS